MTMISGRPMRLHCLVPVLFWLLLISDVNGGLPFRAVGAGASGRTGNVDAGGVANHGGGDDDKIGGWPFRVAFKIPLESIQNITASVSNYEHGRRIEEQKNIPIYVAQATIASLVLSTLGKLWDPTIVIAAINACVWIGWQVGREYNNVLRFMIDNFLLFRDPSHRFKPRQVLLHGFSHISADHIASNLGSLLAVGPLVREYTNWSVVSYSSFYIASIYASSLFNEVVYNPLMKKYHGPKKKQRMLSSRSLGASGAVCAILAFCGLSCPTEKMAVSKKQWYKGSDAVPLWTVATHAFLSDIILPLKSNGKRSNVGHGAHIGGGIFGATVYVVDRLWGAKLHEVACRSAVLLRKPVPVQMKVIASSLRKLCHSVKAAVSGIWRGFCRLPLKEISLVAIMALELIMVDDVRKEE